MSQMPPLRTIANGQPVDAIDPEYNFTAIEEHLRLNVINRDGSVAMQAPLILSGPPTQNSHAANKAYVDNVLPPGVMIDYGSDVLPLDFVGIWAVCNGDAKSKTDPVYSRLYGIIGDRYNQPGVAVGNFNLPNFMQRVAVGADAGVTDFNIGKALGSGSSVATHSHLLAEHTHSIDHDHPAVTTSIGGGHAHSAGTDGQGSHAHWSGPSASHELYGRPEAIDEVIASVAAPSVNFSGWRTGRFLTEAAGVHTHGVTVNPGGDHSHTADVAAHNGSSGPTTPTLATTGATGAATNGNYPPYVTVTKLIKL